MSLPEPFNRHHPSCPYDELAGVMRHEIEHTHQAPSSMNDTADYSDDPFTSKQATLDYFSNPKEVAAWVTGWMKKAKQKRQSLKLTIKDHLDLMRRQAESEGFQRRESVRSAPHLFSL